MAIAPRTLKQLRTKYAEIWGIPWPWDDEYLAQLVVEQKAAHGQGPTSKQLSQRWGAETLVRMREDHPFTVEEWRAANGRTA